jgi:hypothetical protein
LRHCCRRTMASDVGLGRISRVDVLNSHTDGEDLSNVRLSRFRDRCFRDDCHVCFLSSAEHPQAFSFNFTGHERYSRRKSFSRSREFLSNACQCEQIAYENYRKRKTVKGVTQQSQRSGDLKRSASSPESDTNQWQELAFSRLGGIGSKLRHNAVNDWVEDTLR